MSFVSPAAIAALLSRIVRPFGLNLAFNHVDTLDGADYDIYGVVVAGAGHNCKHQVRHEQVLNLPRITTAGNFTHRGLDYALTRVAYQDLNSLTMDYFVKEKSEVLAQILEDTLVKTLTDAFYSGAALSVKQVQSSVDTAISTSKYCQLVDVDNEAQLAQVADSVYLVNDAHAFDVERQMFPSSMLGKLDPATTSASGTINQVFRLVNGAEIKEGRITDGTGMFARNIEDSGIGLAFTPKRLNLLSTQFAQAIKLAKPEENLTVSGPNNQLDGRELVTAVMDCGADTYEDAFMVSESAARALTCIRSYRCRFMTDGDVTVNVAVGDMVTKKDTLAEHVDIRTGDTVLHRAKKIFASAKVVEITETVTDMYGKPCMRYDIVVEEHQVMQTGDKMTTRGGLKGVAIVRPDADMPALECGTPVDICVSPKSLYNRQSVVTWWEMMMNLRGQSFTSVPEFDTPFDQLVRDGYGAKTQLYYASDNSFVKCLGTPLQHETFVAPLFFFRLDKLAHEVLASAGADQKKDEDGVVMDTTTNGQRRDFGYSLAIAAKGLTGMFEDMTSGETPYYVRRVAAAVHGKVDVSELTLVSSGTEARTADYESCTVAELKAACRKLGLKGYGKKGVRKADIVALLREKYPTLPADQSLSVAEQLVSMF